MELSAAGGAGNAAAAEYATRTMPARKGRACLEQRAGHRGKPAAAGIRAARGTRANPEHAR